MTSQEYHAAPVLKQDGNTAAAAQADLSTQGHMWWSFARIDLNLPHLYQRMRVEFIRGIFFFFLKWHLYFRWSHWFEFRGHWRISLADNGTIHHRPDGQEDCVRLCLIAVFTLIAVHQSNGMQVFKNLNQAFSFVFSPVSLKNVHRGDAAKARRP